MRSWFSLVFLSVLIGAASCSEKADESKAESDSAELEALIQQYVDDERGSRGLSEIPDLSAQAFLSKIDKERELLQSLRVISPEGLSPAQKIDLKLLIGRLDSSIYSATKRKRWENDPTIYVSSRGLSRIMLGTGQPPEEAATNLMARLGAVPQMLNEGRANLKNPPKRFTDAAIFQTAQMIKTLETEVPVFADKAGEEKDGLLEANAAAVTALKDFEIFLKEVLLSRSTGNWAIGAEEYNYILEHRWFMEDDVESILEKGRKAFAETEVLAQEVAERIEPGKHWTEVYERLKDDHPPADKLKEAYQAQMDAAKVFLIENEVVTLPEGESVITVDTPPAMRRSSPFGTFNTVGPFDEHLQGRLALTPIEEWMTPEQQSERLRSHHTAWIPIIAVHEAYPGHHIQALKAKENPRILRRVVHESIFGEGWGLFTEEMMFELGFLKGDDVRLTQLRNRLWRAARVIIDTSLHTEQMTIEEAVDFLAEKVRFERYAAELEVGMYPRMPTYVLGYLIGMIEIQDMRRAYYEKFGEPEKPKEFYDKLLAIGAIPPVLVRAELLGESE